MRMINVLMNSTKQTVDTRMFHSYILDTLKPLSNEWMLTTPQDPAKFSGREDGHKLLKLKSGMTAKGEGLCAPVNVGR